MAPHVISDGMLSTECFVMHSFLLCLSVIKIIKQQKQNLEVLRLRRQSHFAGSLRTPQLRVESEANRFCPEEVRASLPKAGEVRDNTRHTLCSQAKRGDLMVSPPNFVSWQQVSKRETNLKLKSCTNLHKEFG